MSQTSAEKFLYFTVGLLKDSAALEALRQDATKYHMIDHPGQLIALRLTEYYEMINQGAVQPGAQASAVKLSPTTETTAGREQMASTDAPQQAVPISSPLSSPSPAAPSDAVFIDVSEPPTVLNQFPGKMRTLRHENENVVSVSSAAEQNADDAADYWSPL